MAVSWRTCVDDAYFWTGAQHTRSFREFRLLQQMAALGFAGAAPGGGPLPRERLLAYRADLITAELPTRLTLSQALQDGSIAQFASGSTIGRCIHRFHARGVHHADLNAHNILLGPAGDVYVLDFDRGRIRQRGAWERVVLARLASLAREGDRGPACRIDSARRSGRRCCAAWATEAGRVRYVYVLLVYLLAPLVMAHEAWQALCGPSTVAGSASGSAS